MSDMQRYTRCIHPRYLAITILILLGVLPVAADDVLLDYVQQKQAAARALLDRYRMDYRVTFQHSNQEKGLSNFQSQQLEVRKFKQGDRMRLEVAESSVGNNQYGVEGARLGEYSHLSNIYLTVNENEVARWGARAGKVSSELSILRHTSAKEMQGKAAYRVTDAQGLDIVDFAFGLNTDLTGMPGDLEKTGERLSKMGTFEAKEAERDGRKVIEIRYIRDGETLFTAVVDPEKGYATTKLKLHAADASAGAEERLEYEITVKEVSDGVWVPDTLQATEWISHAGLVVDSSVTAEVIALELNPVLDPAIFHWPSLNYPGHYIHVYDEAGIGTVMVAKDNRLRPAPLTNEAANTPEAVVATLSETIGHEEKEVPAAAVHPAPPLHSDAPALAVEDKGISVMAVVLGAVAVLAAGGAVVWSRR